MLSTRPGRVCPGCRRVTDGPQCPSCASSARAKRDQGSYGGSWRRHFRPTFFSMLITADVIPSCGAALSTGPVTTDSRCKAAGLTVFTSADGTDLHLDHEPPLLEHERDNPSAVCDATRIQLLCRECHSAKTMREMRHA